MHELSIIQTLLEQVRPYNNRRIHSIHIEVGSLSCADPDRLQFCFDLVKHDAGLADVELLIATATAEAQCSDCRQRFQLTRRGLSCPCGSYDYTLRSGQQLTLTEIEFT